MVKKIGLQKKKVNKVEKNINNEDKKEEEEN